MLGYKLLTNIAGLKFPLPKTWYSKVYEYNVKGEDGGYWMVNDGKELFYTISTGITRSIQKRHGNATLTLHMRQHYVLSQEGVDNINEMLVNQKL